jgi:hypothetical protein
MESRQSGHGLFDKVAPWAFTQYGLLVVKLVIWLYGPRNRVTAGVDVQRWVIDHSLGGVSNSLFHDKGLGEQRATLRRARDGGGADQSGATWM